MYIICFHGKTICLLSNVRKLSEYWISKAGLYFQLFFTRECFLYLVSTEILLILLTHYFQFNVNIVNHIGLYLKQMLIACFYFIFVRSLKSLNILESNHSINIYVVWLCRATRLPVSANFAPGFCSIMPREGFEPSCTVIELHTSYKQRSFFILFLSISLMHSARERTIFPINT